MKAMAARRSERLRMMKAFSGHHFCSVDKLQRKLNLPRVPGRLADQAKAGPFDGIRRQPHVHDIEQIEELSAKLQIEQLDPALALPEWRVLDEGKIVIVISRPAKRIPPQSAEAPVVRPRPARDIHRNIKERFVGRAAPEVILPPLPRRR